MKTKPGFTLIELLVVIAIIGLLAAVVMAALNTSRIKSRDAKRLSDMKQILTALEVYYDRFGYYPASSDNDCSSFDTGYAGGPNSGDTFINELVSQGIMGKVPGDPKTFDDCEGYQYRKYPAGNHGCPGPGGDFIVLGVWDLEGSPRPHPDSPGFVCNNKDWQDDFDWVVGRFEE